MLTKIQSFLGVIAKPESQQIEREAIIELMLMTMYIDKSLKLSEDEVLNKYLSGISWESPFSIQQFLGLATAKVRNALADKDKMKAFLEDINSKFTSSTIKQQAFEICGELAIADGNLTQSEREFLDAMGQILKNR